MNDLYSAAAQVIPVLLLALIVDLRLPSTTGPPTLLARFGPTVIIWSVVAEVLALAGLSFDEERSPVLNAIVAIAVWASVLMLMVVTAHASISVLRASRLQPSGSRVRPGERPDN